MLRTIFCIGILYCCACTKEKVTLRECKNYIRDKDHGLMQDVQFEKYNVALAYKPEEMMVCQYSGDSCIDQSTFDTVSSNFKGFYYFDMEYHTNGKELTYGLSNSYSDYSELLKRMSFRMGEFVYATSGKDTMRLADFNVSNFYGLADRTWMLIAFNKVKNIEQKEYFDVHIRDIRGIEPERTIQIKLKDIKNVPGIIFCKK